MTDQWVRDVVDEVEQRGTDTTGELYEPIVITNRAFVHIHPEARVDSFCKIEGGQGVYIGRWVHIASFVHLNIGGGETIFEEGSAAASGCKVVSGSNMMSGLSCSAKAPTTQQVVVRKRTVIGRNAVLFANVTVVPGVTIGAGAVVAAGAVVMHDVPAYEIWAGVPAHKVGERVRPVA